MTAPTQHSVHQAGRAWILTIAFILAATSRAEFYTANGALDPGTLTNADRKAIIAQGWVLQRSWQRDTNACKTFRLAQPGNYNQMLPVWDALGLHPMPQNWARLEMFGVASLWRAQRMKWKH